MGGPCGGGGFGMPDFKTLTQPRVHFSSVGSNFGSTFTIGTWVWIDRVNVTLKFDLSSSKPI